MTDEAQPVDLAAFLATAEYAITQAPKDVTDGTGESLRSAGTYYAPRLFAAVEAVLNHANPDRGYAVTSRRVQEIIARELLGGEGE